MDSTAPTTAVTNTGIPPVSPETLAMAFATVPDPRRQASIAYPLPAILSLAVAAILCAHTSVLAIAEWGARQDRDLLRRLGFAGDRTPCQPTLQRLFARLDGHALSAALGAVFAPLLEETPRAPGSQGIAIDGKAQRGRFQYQSGGSPVHMLVAFCQEAGVVLAEEPIEQGQDKAEAELTVAPALIDRIDWQGRVLTGDALFCQRSLCSQVIAAGGDYLLLVKANQPRLYNDLALCFDPSLDLLDRREAQTIDQGHGRTAEVRHLVASTDLNDYLDWPGLAQVFRSERSWWEHGEHKQQVRFGITSLLPTVGTPARLLALKRQHWLIENQGHRSKDVTLGEDASLVHVGDGPTVFALLRTAALNLLRSHGCRTITAQLRAYSQHPHQAVALVCDPPPTHA